MGSSARNDGLFKVIVVSGRIADFPPNNLEYVERLDLFNRFDRRPLDVLEATEDPTAP